MNRLQRSAVDVPRPGMAGWPRLARWACLVALVFATGQACGRTRRPSPRPPQPTPRQPSEAPQPVPPPTHVVEEPAPAPIPELSEELEQAEADVGNQAKAVPSEPPAPAALPARVRVGLATDLSSVELSCCAAGLVARAQGRNIAILNGLLVEPGVEVSQPPIFRLQLAALRDEAQAEELALRYRQLMGSEADSLFDATDGLYRVRWGRFATREEADTERSRLLEQGMEAWVVTEQPALRSPSIKVTRGDQRWIVQGRWLELEALGEEGIPYGKKRYRGELLVYLNDRGKLNLINLISLDDYLRGVVPREMGPEVYDDLDALKAQAIAARTYTLRNMGEFRSEGFDICATPRCQVYGGMTGEHPLSDRAVLETSGEVLIHAGSLADALYSSTCGGHTEDVEVVFPEKSHAYLRGVPCLEAGVDRLAGEVGDASLETSVIQKLLERLSPGAPPVEFASRLRLIVQNAGLKTPEYGWGSNERREVQRFLARRLDLEFEAELFAASEDLSYLLAAPPADWTEADLKLAAVLAQNGILDGRLDQPPSPRQLEHALFGSAVFLRQIEKIDARYLKIVEGRLIVRRDGEEESWSLPEGLPTFRRAAGQTELKGLTLVPGDRLEAYVSGSNLLTILQEVDPDGISFDRTSSFRSWSRFRSDRRLAELVDTRYPTFELDSFELVGRGVSGRVKTLELRDNAGETVEVRGLPIRWTLDLPDTLFTARRLNPAGGESGWLFSGRGWGHGVGMCQVGAYGMALRGHSYAEILEHYYTGIELGRIPTAAQTAAAR